MADDFNIVGNIDRVVAEGFAGGSVSFQGVYVRFYEYLADGTPGQLQKEYFLTTGYSAGRGLNSKSDWHADRAGFKRQSRLRSHNGDKLAGPKWQDGTADRRHK